VPGRHRLTRPVGEPLVRRERGHRHTPPSRPSGTHPARALGLGIEGIARGPLAPVPLDLIGLALIGTATGCPGGGDPVGRLGHGGTSRNAPAVPASAQGPSPAPSAPRAGATARLRPWRPPGRSPGGHPDREDAAVPARPA